MTEQACALIETLGWTRIVFEGLHAAKGEGSEDGRSVIWLLVWCASSRTWYRSSLGF